VRLSVAFLIYALFVEVAAAQWRADVSGGAFLAASTTTLTDRHLGRLCCGTAGDAADVNFGAGAVWALGLGYAVSDHVEIVGRFQHALSRYVASADLLTYGYRLPIDTVNSSLDVFSVTAGGRFHLLPPGQQFRPWVVTEAGWYHANGEVNEPFCGRSSCGPPFVMDEKTEHGVGFNVGAGFDLAVTDTVSVGLEARYHRVFVLGDFGFLAPMANLGFHF
jgi:opacity protein-like surface antigen